MNRVLIKGATLINEGLLVSSDILIENGRIEKIGKVISINKECAEINADGLYVLPGVIDDQVHFREPGLTHKADVYTESRAAVAGGVTSFMEMPNTLPPALTNDILEEKYINAGKCSPANYSFYLGASNDNIEEIKQVDSSKVCGVKIFMGSSTGNMLVDNEKALELIFAESPMLIATHCEDEATIKENLEFYIRQYGDDIPMKYHPLIRSHKACYLSSSKAIDLARRFNSRLHILHISTKEELSLFNNDVPLNQKRISSEVCVHHLSFNDNDYKSKGTFIKWNPAVKGKDDQEALLKGLKDGVLDVVATDHAPHTLAEKAAPYTKAPSGGPLIQHALLSMLEFYHQNKLTLPQIVEKMAHNPAICFEIKDRGYIREGYWADLVLVDINKQYQVRKDNLLYKCGWSPFDGKLFNSAINMTLVNGRVAYNNGQIIEGESGMRLEFNRS
jgi:dihydroorotase